MRKILADTPIFWCNVIHTNTTLYYAVYCLDVRTAFLVLEYVTAKKNDFKHK